MHALTVWVHLLVYLKPVQYTVHNLVTVLNFFFWYVGIDGFSRCVVYLKCSANNRADTVLRLFVEATNTFGAPSRIRCDQGIENVDVA